MHKVAILGCGPAGLLAAHACEQQGFEPDIYSNARKSVIPGSVYLHERVPGLTGMYPDNHVQYVRLGTEEGYAEKVYGDASRTTGWQNYTHVYPSWNAVVAYDLLWAHWKDSIIDGEITFRRMRELILGYDLVITTLPANLTCFRQGKHRFRGQKYWIKTLPVPPDDRNRDIVVYNGLPGDLWYRWSVLSGICSIESTHDLWPKDPDVVSGIKCTENDCDCWEHPNVIRAGRWAQWRHGILLNDAYKVADEAIRNHAKKSKEAA